MGDLHVMGTAKHQADLFDREALRRDRRGKASLVQGGEAVRDFHKFIKVLADYDDPCALGGEVQKRLPDRGCGGGIDAPCGLVDHQDLRVLHDLATADEFLQIAARK